MDTHKVNRPASCVLVHVYKLLQPQNAHHKPMTATYEGSYKFPDVNIFFPHEYPVSTMYNYYKSHKLVHCNTCVTSRCPPYCAALDPAIRWTEDSGTGAKISRMVGVNPYCPVQRVNYGFGCMRAIGANPFTPGEFIVFSRFRWRGRQSHSFEPQF